MTSPSFAIVSAVYGVARYLPEFFTSLESQTYPHEKISVILVDDGSEDESGELCEQWAAETSFRVKVIHQQNAGQASARNTGIDNLGTEDWVTFTDPDDFLDPEYFSRVAGSIKQEQDVHLVATHHVDYWEDDPARGDRHALRFRFASGDRVVDIERYPRNFHMHVASSGLRVDVLRRSGLRFDDRVKPVFEDAHFLSKYLLLAEVPLVAYLDSAVYYYRRRGDGTSTMQNAKSDPRRYTDVLEFGTRDLLHHALRVKGRIPDWLQYLVIYDLAWIYRSEDALHGAFKTLTEEECDRYHQLAGECLRLLDPLNVEAYPDVKRTTAQREAMVHGYSKNPWRWESVVIDGVDQGRGLVKLVYHYTGSAPAEEFLVAGRTVSPRHAKTRDFIYLRCPLVHERIVWVPSNGTLQVRLDGRIVPLTGSWPTGRTNAMRPAQISRLRRKDIRSAAVAPSGRSTTERALNRSKKSRSSSSEERKVRRAEYLARRGTFARMFKDAWVLMDRSHNAHDNAEHLFKYLRSERRDINAWFVVRKGTADWNRLRAEGYKRVIPHGSLIWMILCLHATHMVSSHVDRYVVEPFSRRGGWRWRYTFLQHGVTQADLSRWLNSKRIDLFITASRDEYASIAGDGSAYAFTSHEVQRTGFPRHDRLMGLAQSSRSAGGKGHVLVMPTWRAYFSQLKSAGTGERGAHPEFFASDFAREWQALLADERVLELCRREDRELVFMPHPNLEPYLEGFDLPEDVRVATYADVDVQQMIAGADAMITDYSSVAVDAAFVGRPVVYFQFDRREFLGGGHIGRPGYFDYETHGFGPVVATVDGVLDALERCAEVDFSVPSEYAKRTRAAFGAPKSGACERVTRAIEDLSRPLSKRQLETSIPTPVAPSLAVDQVVDAVRGDDA